MPHTPGAAQVEPVEMHELRVGAVGHGGRLKSARGSPCFASGRNRANQARNSGVGKTRRMRSASIKLGEKKSAPPGSHAAGMPASDPK